MRQETTMFKLFLYASEKKGSTSQRNNLLPVGSGKANNKPQKGVSLSKHASKCTMCIHLP